MPKISRLQEAINRVTQDVLAHPSTLSRLYAERFNISRVSANKLVQQLETEGWITRGGSATHPIFSPGSKRYMAHLYPLDQLEEHLVWERDFKPLLTLPNNVQNIAHTGFTEMLNNAIDHSSGHSVYVLAMQDATNLRLCITDDGVGIFAKISNALKLPDMRQAIFELSKGKLTTDPSNHSGEGVFFTARMFDTFEISANGLQFSHDTNLTHNYLLEAKETWNQSHQHPMSQGTKVSMSIQLSSPRTAKEVYDQFTEAPEDYDFSKTIVPMKLARFGDEQLVSRSQAKRLIARFDCFKTIVLDFSEIQEIGQAFADELFRVYANKHPDLNLRPENMTEQVERMWRRATAARKAQLAD